jgi:hypothetical protein
MRFVTSGRVEINDGLTSVAALYSIATHIAFEEAVLRAIEASRSQAEYEARVSRIIEEKATPVVCNTCCPRRGPHRHEGGLLMEPYWFAEPRGPRSQTFRSYKG